MTRPLVNESDNAALVVALELGELMEKQEYCLVLCPTWPDDAYANIESVLVNHDPVLKRALQCLVEAGVVHVRREKRLSYYNGSDRVWCRLGESMERHGQELETFVGMVAYLDHGKFVAYQQQLSQSPAHRSSGAGHFVGA